MGLLEAITVVVGLWLWQNTPVFRAFWEAAVWKWSIFFFLFFFFFILSVITTTLPCFSFIPSSFRFHFEMKLFSLSWCLVFLCLAHLTPCLNYISSKPHLYFWNGSVPLSVVPTWFPLLNDRFLWARDFCLYFLVVKEFKESCKVFRCNCDLRHLV